MKKHTCFLPLLVIAFISFDVNAELYSAVYDEPGFKMTLNEIRRSETTSTLKLDVIKPDAQGGFTLIKAACVIGKELRKSHFTFISEEPLIKIYFTSDISDDPMIILKREKSKFDRKYFSEKRYFEISKICRIFPIN
ncbi:MAG: hypothetical protein COB04_12365 [Gammaproteobacteria bacterium]|nr:MAG: hypothetical protein COB04_12365 [Gammaproteobacteria bacterium]